MTVRRTNVFSNMLLTCCAALFFSTIAVAEPLWVIGSFSEQDNAVRERDRVRSDTGLAAEVNESNGYFRVVVPKSSASKSDVENQGFTPWSLDGDVMTGLTASGPKNSYRVLASFVEQNSAELLLDRLESDGTTGVAVIPVEVQGVLYHRLVQGPFSNRSDATDDFSSYGLAEPWWWEVRDTGSSSTAMASSSSSSSTSSSSYGRSSSSSAMRDESDDTYAMETMEPEPEPVITITPPSANENYVTYCLNANKTERAMFCGNNLFKRVGVAGLREGNEAAASLLTCAYASRDSAGNCQ